MKEMNETNEFLTEINNRLRDLHPICKRMGRHYPKHHRQTYWFIYKPKKRRFSSGNPMDLKCVFSEMNRYKPIFKSMRFTPPAIGNHTIGKKEDHEISVIAHYTRRMIGNLLGQWHRGPLDNLDKMDIPIEQKRQYILDYIDLLIEKAGEIDLAIPKGVNLEDSLENILTWRLPEAPEVPADDPLLL